MASAFERMLSDIQRESPVIKPDSPEPSTLDSISAQFSKKVRESVEVNNTQIPPTGAEVFPEQVEETDATDIGDKLAFGFAQSMSGSSEAGAKPWVVSGYKYLTAEYPEIAAKMGLYKKGSKKELTDSSIINAVLDYSKAAQTSFVSSLVDMFGSEQQIEEWDKLFGISINCVFEPTIYSSQTPYIFI